jgi:hypothetical protein
VSAQRLHDSVIRLQGIADALEAGVSPARLMHPAAPHVEAVGRIVEPPARRSMARTVVSSLVSSAAVATALLATFAIADPLLPHPDRPSLAQHEEVVSSGSGWLQSIPESGANQP